jgi:HNH endonuclease
MHKILDIERIRLLLNYCPVTDKLSWKTRRNSQALQDQEAGYIAKEGYRVIGFDYKIYQAHRVAWAHYYGSFPAEDVDHINHNRSDNRIVNLREVNDLANLRNKSKSKVNSSGHTGVYKNSAGNWIARICVLHKQINLGTFSTKESAYEIRKAAELAFSFHPNHGI